MRTTAAEETTDESPRRRITTADAAITAPETAGVERASGLRDGTITPADGSPYHSDIEHVTMAYERGVALVNDGVHISGDIEGNQ